jgi:hypothetical protein
MHFLPKIDRSFYFNQGATLAPVATPRRFHDR